MSKLKMLKFEAATLQNKGKELIEEMQRAGVAEIESFNDVRLFESAVFDSVSEYEKSMNVITEALGVLSENGAKMGGGMFSGREALDKSVFAERTLKVSESIAAAYEILRLKKSISDTKSESVRLITQRDTLKIWEKLDIPMTGASTETSSVFVGTLPGEYSYDSLSMLLAQNLPEIREYSFEIVHSSKQITAVAFVCHKSVEKDVYSYLRSISFMPPTDVSDIGVKERISELDKSISSCNDAVVEAENKLKACNQKVDELKFAYDYCKIKSEEYRALSDVKFSDKTIYLKGYVPEVSSEKLKEIVVKNDGAVVFSEPSEDDDVPVALSNGPFSEPVEGIVEMYATPGKKDIDPSGVMAFFYYLLFGMMLSDAGYGLIMTIGTAIILKKTSVEGSLRKSLKMFFYCGISTVVWGALFGSWFGDIVPVICTNFLGIQNPPSVALWFEPLADPITLLLFSFVIGICHLFLGLIVLGYMKWKEGDKAGAIFDTVPIMMTVLGAAPLAGGILAPMPDSVTGIAKWVLIAGVVLIVLTSSRSSKNIIARLGGGIYGLYNTASGYLSDILSYSRLLALGLATGSIASVVNMLGVMPQNTVVKAIVFVIVFIVGHSLNMAINVLGAYVHTNRLQFVELFSKFYEGGGKAFSPFTLGTKYYKLKEEIKND